MKNVLLFLLFILPFISLSQSYQWEKQLRTAVLNGSLARTYGKTVAEDCDGNVITAIFATDFIGPQDIIDLDPGNWTYNFSVTPGSDDLVLQKLDKYGNFLWAFHIPISSVELEGLRVDCNNNIYLAIAKVAPFDIDPGPGITNISGECIAEYDPSGNLIWHWTYNGGTDLVKDFTIDKQGNLYAIAFLDSIVDLDPGIGIFHITPLSQSTMVMFKWNYNHDLCWAKTFVGGGGAQGAGDSRIRISLNNNENCIALSGEFFSSFDFDPGPAAVNFPVYNSSTNTDIFISKFDTSGNFIWGNCIGSPSLDYEKLSCLSFDSQDNIIISGNFNDSINFNPTGSASFSYSNGARDFFVAKFSSNGILSWGKTFGTINDDDPPSTAVDASGNVYSVSNFSTSGDFDPGPGVYSLTNGSLNSVFIQKLDQSGNFVKAGKIDSIVLSVNQVYNVISSIFLGKNNLYITGYLKGFVDFDPWQGELLSYSSLPHSFTLKLLSESNLVSGVCYNDANNNALQDTNELPMKYIPVQLGPVNYSGTDSTGRYYFNTDTGNYQITTSANYYTVNPPSQNVYFSSYNNTDTTKNFGFYAANNINDLVIEITNVTAARAGRDIVFLVNYKNAGTTMLTPDINFIIDSNLSFINSVPMQNFLNGDTLSYSIGNLQPLQTGSIMITLHVNQTVPVNTILTFSSTINPVAGDFTPSNNVSVLRLTVIASFDPNDKQVNPADYTWQQFQTGDYLYYTIRFQNTGNDTAFHIHIIDTLDDKLDPTSFEIVSSSHNCTPYMSGNGIFDFQFYYVNLPDSNINELLSHGFVKYKIKPKNSLQLNDVIENTAYIYFDFNQPVVTNTVINPVTTAVQELSVKNNDFTIYPNPGSGIINVSARNLKPGKIEFDLYAMSGKKIKQLEFDIKQANSVFNLNFPGISNGVYQLKIKIDDYITSRKIIIIR